MISSHDRSSWFGASDTSIIMGNWDTKTFARWWLVKQGIIKSDFTNGYMMAGTAYEHRILDAMGVAKRDRQIKIHRLRLRVNLDGETSIIHEVKTHKNDFVLSHQYWQQAQVEMFAAKKGLEIVAYQMTDYDYQNFYNPIDLNRVHRYPVEYDPQWINEQYLPRLKYLAYCLKKGVCPKHDFR